MTATIQETRTGRTAGPARPGRGLRHSLTIAGRNTIQVLRTPELLVFSAVQPIMLVLLFNYVFGGAIQTPGVEYIDFLIPGIVVMTVAFASFGTGIGLNVDLANGMADRFRSLPIVRSAYLTGRILADTVRIMGNVLLLLGWACCWGCGSRPGRSRRSAGSCWPPPSGWPWRGWRR
jgi:oleandomycin transport system permease protein